MIYSEVPTRLIFLRHGEAEHNVNDTVDSAVTSTVSLTDFGREQAKEAGLRLRDERLDLILCSPLLRTRQTAEIVAELLDYPREEIHTIHELREIDCGEWDGQSFQGYLKLFDQATDFFYKNPHRGESEQDLLKRVSAYLKQVLLNPEYAGRKLLFVTHGAVIRTAYMALTGTKPEEIYDFSKEERWMCPTGAYRTFDLDVSEGKAPLWKRLRVTAT